MSERLYPRGRMFAAFFVAALLFRLAVAAATGMFHWLERSEVEVIAWNVTRFGLYNLYDSPTAHATPVFPLYLAALFGIFGTGTLAQAVSATIACAISALRCALLPIFALDAGFTLLVSLLAGVLSVFYIGSVDTEVSGKMDGPFVALALLLLIWALLRLWRSGSWRTRTPWGFLAFCGFCALLNPGLLPVLGGILLAGGIACPAQTRRRYWSQTGLVALSIFLCLLPWAIRNQMALGSPIFTRSNFGLEFWVSNGPGRTFDMSNNIGDVLHPSGHAAETAKVAELGEVAYNREKLTEAMDWVESNPGDFARLTAERMAAWWFPPHPHLLVVPKCVLTLAAFAGLWILFRSQRVLGWLFLITWVAFPAIYYGIQWIGRYRTPMDWQILLCAAVFLFRISAPKRPFLQPNLLNLGPFGGQSQIQ